MKDEEYLGGVMGLSQDLSRCDLGGGGCCLALAAFVVKAAVIFIEDAGLAAVFEGQGIDQHNHASTHQINPTNLKTHRWAIQRAAHLDVAAVGRCRDLLTALNGKLLEFDFRNGGLRCVRGIEFGVGRWCGCVALGWLVWLVWCWGCVRAGYVKARMADHPPTENPLTHNTHKNAHRRKYDGVKWGVRRMEDLLYELSVVGVFPPSAADARWVFCVVLSLLARAPTNGTVPFIPTSILRLTVTTTGPLDERYTHYRTAAVVTAATGASCPWRSWRASGSASRPTTRRARR